MPVLLEDVPVVPADRADRAYQRRILALEDGHVARDPAFCLLDPLGKIGPPSNGTGSGGGIGSGKGGGVGSGEGGGLGPGKGGGFGGDVYRVGNGVTPPIKVYTPEPEYSEEARKAKYSGEVTLSVIIGTDGLVRRDSIQVVHSLGLGLDEQAVKAVSQWRFKPGTLNGKPVAVQAQILVNFRLL